MNLEELRTKWMETEARLAAVEAVNAQILAAPKISAVAASAPSQKFTLTVPRMTIHSPMNPAVPGRPQLAIANSTAKAANLGMVLTTPP